MTPVAIEIGGGAPGASLPILDLSLPVQPKSRKPESPQAAADAVTPLDADDDLSMLCCAGVDLCLRA
jgi:hypothetical protein